MNKAILFATVALCFAGTCTGAAADSCNKMKGKELTVTGKIENIQREPDSSGWKAFTQAGISDNCVIVELSKQGVPPNTCAAGSLFIASGKVSTDVIAAAEENLGYDSAALRQVTAIKCF